MSRIRCACTKEKTAHGSRMVELGAGRTKRWTNSAPAGRRVAYQRGVRRSGSDRRANHRRRQGQSQAGLRRKGKPPRRRQGLSRARHWRKGEPPRHRQGHDAEGNREEARQQVRWSGRGGAAAATLVRWWREDAHRGRSEEAVGIRAVESSRARGRSHLARWEGRIDGMGLVVSYSNQIDEMADGRMI